MSPRLPDTSRPGPAAPAAGAAPGSATEVKAARCWAGLAADAAAVGPGAPDPGPSAPPPRFLGIRVPAAIANRLGERRLGVLLELVRFTAVGGLGFFVDAGSLRLALILGLGPWVGRLLSYLAAATFTYFLNRAWTFRDRAGAGGAGQWARFLLFNLGGFLANYGVYALLLVNSETVARWPEIGVGVGALAGLVVNFSLSRRFVFKAPA